MIKYRMQEIVNVKVIVMACVYSTIVDNYTMTWQSAWMCPPDHDNGNTAATYEGGGNQ